MSESRVNLKAAAVAEKRKMAIIAGLRHVLGMRFN